MSQDSGGNSTAMLSVTERQPGFAQSRMESLGPSTEAKELGEERVQSLGARSGWGGWKAVGGLKHGDMGQMSVGL